MKRKSKQKSVWSKRYTLDILKNFGKFKKYNRSQENERRKRQIERGILKTLVILLLLTTNCYAGVDFAMTGESSYEMVPERSEYELNGKPLVSRISVCTVVIVNNKRMRHILPTENWPVYPELHLKKILSDIEPGDSVTVVMSEDLDILDNSYRIVTGEIVYWFLKYVKRVKDLTFYDADLQKHYRFVILDQDGWDVIDQDSYHLHSVGASMYAGSIVIKEN